MIPTCRHKVTFTHSGFDLLVEIPNLGKQNQIISTMPHSNSRPTKSRSVTNGWPVPICFGVICYEEVEIRSKGKEGIQTFLSNMGAVNYKYFMKSGQYILIVSTMLWSEFILARIEVLLKLWTSKIFIWNVSLEYTWGCPSLLFGAM